VLLHYSIFCLLTVGVFDLLRQKSLKSVESSDFFFHSPQSAKISIFGQFFFDEFPYGKSDGAGGTPGKKRQKIEERRKKKILKVQRSYSMRRTVTATQR